MINMLVYQFSKEKLTGTALLLRLSRVQLHPRLTGIHIDIFLAHCKYKLAETLLSGLDAYLCSSIQKRRLQK